jgi:hypothetical protein
MRLDAFILADAVSAPPDGKFNVLGGGLTKLTVPILPFTAPFGLLIRLEVTEEEARAPHEFVFTWLDPAGVLLMPPVTFSGQAQDVGELVEGEERFVMLALNIGGVPFGRPGPHKLEFRVDGELLRTAPLPVVALSQEELAALQHGPPPAAALPQGNRAQRRAQQRKGDR